jgi:hypothetical protein
VSEAEGRRYFNALLSLDRRPEALELRASGVTEATISNLYPSEFTDLVPGLVELLSPGSLESLRSMRAVDLPWAKFASPWGNLLVATTNSTRAFLSAANAEFNLSPESWTLRKQIVAVMPLENAQDHSGRMANQLFQLHWHMTNSKSAEHTQRANAALSFVLERTFPDFIERVRAL